MTDHQKKSTVRRIVRWTLFSLLGLVALLTVAIGIVLHVILSPQKLTPIAEQAAAEYLHAEARFGKIELTFFSTFPDVGLEMKDASLVSQVFRDTTGGKSATARDSLLYVKSALITVNPMAYLSKKRIVVKDFVLEEPKIYAYVDTAGIANWDIALPTDTLELETPADTLASDTLATGIRLRNIRIRGGQVIFDDRSTRLYTRIDGLDMGLDGWLGKRRSRLKLKFSTRNILFWQEGQLLVKRLALGMETNLKVRRDSALYTLEKAVFDVNGVRFGAGGTLRGDSVNRRLRVDMKYGIHIPTLKTLLDLVPDTLLKKTDDIRVQGEVSCKGAVNGYYGKENIPQITAEFNIKDGAIAYPGMPSQIDTLNLAFSAFIDLQKEQESYIDLHRFCMKGGGTDIDVEGRIGELLTSPLVKAKVEAFVDFEDLTQIFPLADGITCQGTLDAGLRGKVRVSDVTEGNYGKIYLGGKLKARDVEIFIPKDSIVAKIRTAGVAFATNRDNEKTVQGKDLLNGFVGYSGLDVHVKNRVRLLMDSTYVTVKTSPLRDTTAVASMSSNVRLGRTVFIVRDTLLLGLKQAKANGRLEPSKRNKKNPKIHANVIVDSLRTRVMANRLNLGHAEFEVDAVRNPRNPDMWIPSGFIDFTGLQAYTPLFPLKIRMPGTRLRFNMREIQLDSALLRLGRSDIHLTGKLTNLSRAFFRNDTLRGELLISSRRIAGNQLMRALEQGTAYMAKLEAGFRDTITGNGETDDIDDMKVVSDADTTAYEGGSSIFMVPPRVDFTLQTDIGRARFGKMKLDSIHGEVVIRNQCIQLENLVLKTAAADMSTTAVYKATDTLRAYTGFALQMHDIRVDSLVRMMPDLDTLFPMLRSFAGTVDFHVAGDAWLDSTLTIDLPTLRGAAYLHGENMVLMDGETFAEISKMLMFKNKERNLIDSISVDLSIKDGTLSVFPFMVEIDRYKAAVGGEHNLDMSFKYHISLLKSPLPFRAGLDVYGNLDKMKYKITKAKYKDIFMPTKRTRVDSTQLNLKQHIRDLLHVNPKP